MTHQDSSSELELDTKIYKKLAYLTQLSIESKDLQRIHHEQRKIVREIKTLLKKDRQELLKRIEGELPEKHEQKLSGPNSPNYDEDKARFYRNGGRNFVIDRVQAIINTIKAEI